jgi:hypothetical protein
MNTPITFTDAEKEEIRQRVLERAKLQAEITKQAPPKQIREPKERAIGTP